MDQGIVIGLPILIVELPIFAMAMRPQQGAWIDRILLQVSQDRRGSKHLSQRKECLAFPTKCREVFRIDLLDFSIFL